MYEGNSPNNHTMGNSIIDTVAGYHQNIEYGISVKVLHFQMSDNIEK